jgi:hypothetical protein
MTTIEEQGTVLVTAQKPYNKSHVWTNKPQQVTINNKKADKYGGDPMKENTSKLIR